jgi:ribosomal protein L32
MARVTCRCGETLQVKSGDPDRLVCSKCGAKIRVHRGPSAPRAAGAADDGYLRFNCPCGRRLKVKAADRPDAGKCPDCERVVPVPESAWASPESLRGAGGQAHSGRGRPNARTEDMDAVDLERLEQWASRHLAESNSAENSKEDATTGSYQSLAPALVEEPVRGSSPSSVKIEAGLRVCPRCGKPLHMSATVCRECGEPAPRR